MMKLRCFTDEKLFDILKDACIKESIFWTERKYFPVSEELVTSTERDEMMSYLLEVCDRSDMAFSIETFSLTVTLIDRFLASFKVKSKYLECLSVSCLYIAAKIREEDEKISITSEFLLECNSKCSVNELLRMEIMILKKFDWSVDDITAADFLYMFHAILVNKYNRYASLNKSSVVVAKNKWNVVDSVMMDSDSAFPPTDLDFLHSLEYKLKQLLCTHELATLFRSRVIAFALLSVQVEKVFDQDDNENVPSKSIKTMIYETMQQLQNHAKITDDCLFECKSKVTEYLETIDADKNLMESYMDQYYSEMAKNHRSNSRLSVTLSTIAKHLTAIKEEDETEEMTTVPQQPSRILASISNQFKRQSSAMDTGASNFCESSDDLKNNADKTFSYADIVLGFKRDNKRKLSENSMTDEDYEFDYENQRH
jgi:hypothetical protein